MTSLPFRLKLSHSRYKFSYRNKGCCMMCVKPNGASSWLCVSLNSLCVYHTPAHASSSSQSCCYGDGDESGRGVGSPPCPSPEPLAWWTKYQSNYMFINHHNWTITFFGDQTDNTVSNCECGRRNVTGLYLWAASGSALRRERLAFRGTGLSGGRELRGLSTSRRGASGRVLRKAAHTHRLVFERRLNRQEPEQVLIRQDEQSTHFLRMMTARLSLMSCGRMQWVMSSAA